MRLRTRRISPYSAGSTQATSPLSHSAHHSVSSPITPLSATPNSSNHQLILPTLSPPLPNQSIDSPTSSNSTSSLNSPSATFSRSSKEIVAYEVFGDVALAYEAIGEMELDLAVKEWAFVKGSEAMKEVSGMADRGEMSSFGLMSFKLCQRF